MRPCGLLRFAILAALVGVAAVVSYPAAPNDDLPVTGTVHPALASFDRLMTSFVKQHEIPGAALAVAKDGHLLYERGFGYADRATKEPVKPDALFRIASISKPFTAVAILQLVERGKLKLDDRVFDVLGLAAPGDADVKFDERWRKVTIQHLLHHTGGWDRGKSFDPMFRPLEIARTLKTKPPAGPRDVIHYMLRFPLDFDPGTKYAYSNFGYCLLGRVIEKVSGMGYEDYVQRDVLAPLGIRRMHLGYTLLPERRPEEVHYYAKGKLVPAVLGPDIGKPVPWPYGGWYLEAMDSHGAWIASAGDLVRFAAAFNEPAKCKILNARSIAVMFAPPHGPVGHQPDGKSKNRYYACGWSVVLVGPFQMNTFHDGSLDGTSTLLVRRFDNLTWAVLFNTRDMNGKGSPSGAIDGLLHKAADEVKTWPSRR